MFTAVESNAMYLLICFKGLWNHNKRFHGLENLHPLLASFPRNPAQTKVSSTFISKDEFSLVAPRKRSTKLCFSQKFPLVILISHGLSFLFTLKWGRGHFYNKKNDRIFLLDTVWQFWLCCFKCLIAWKIAKLSVYPHPGANDLMWQKEAKVYMACLDDLKKV